ncbi:MAG: hypothetical protein KY460_10220 [Actinobacteria bacterium]|nr:hypothetical protein [Actinomycetota bacterium]
MSDLRNIVDRLDLLMGASSTTTTEPIGGRTTVDKTVGVLTERLATLEHEVEELRTLVNHLMTIATWQAKVTATLVEDGVTADDGEDQPQARKRSDAPSGSADQSVQDTDKPARHVDDDEQQRGDRQNRGDSAPPAPRTTTLDDDIDDILGSSRRSSRQTPPPDFGI